jgi:hypothetical protein
MVLLRISASLLLLGLTTFVSGQQPQHATTGDLLESFTEWKNCNRRQVRCDTDLTDSLLPDYGLAAAVARASACRAFSASAASFACGSWVECRVLAIVRRQTEFCARGVDAFGSHLLPPVAFLDGFQVVLASDFQRAPTGQLLPPSHPPRRAGGRARDHREGEEWHGAQHHLGEGVRRGVAAAAVRSPNRRRRTVSLLQTLEG